MPSEAPSRRARSSSRGKSSRMARRDQMPVSGSRVARSRSSFQLEDTQANPQPGIQLVTIERLDDVVIRAGVQARDQITFLVARSEQQYVNVRARKGTQPP